MSELQVTATFSIKPGQLPAFGEAAAACLEYGAPPREPVVATEGIQTVAYSQLQSLRVGSRVCLLRTGRTP